MARKIMSKRVKMDVHSRDGWQCKKCGRRAHPGKGKNLHAHHIVAEMDGGQCEPDNMITLCAHCHQEWHFVESVTVIPFTDWLQAPPYLALYTGWRHGDRRDSVNGAAMAKLEAATITERVMSGKAQKAQEGGYNGAQCPLGYKYDSGVFTVDSGAADTVKEVFERFVAGQTMSGIASALNESGAPTAKGGAWLSLIHI